MPPTKKKATSDIPLKNLDVVCWVKNDWLEFDIPSFKFQIKKAAKSSSTVIELSEIKKVFEEESNDMLFKVLSQKLISHWRKTLSSTYKNKKFYNETFMGNLEEVLTILSLPKFYLLYERIIPLILEFYNIGKEYALSNDHTNAIVWFQHALNIYRHRKMSSSTSSKTQNFNIWFLFEYLGHSYRKAGLHKESYNTLIEGLFREPEKLKEAVYRWYLTTRDVIGLGKLPKYITLASGFAKYLPKTPSLSSSMILNEELRQLEKYPDKRNQPYLDAIMHQLTEECGADVACKARLMLMKASVLKFSQDKHLEAMEMVEEVLVICSEGVHVEYAHALMLKFLFAFPSDNSSLNINSQMKDLDALQNKEETTESPLDTENQTNTCIKDDLLTTTCDFQLVIRAYDIYKVTWNSKFSSVTPTEFDLEHLKLLAAILELHQHPLAPGCFILLLKLGFSCKDVLTVLWGIGRFVNILLNLNQIVASYFFIECMEKLFVKRFGGIDMKEEFPGEWLEFLTCKCLVFLRNNQIPKLLVCLDDIKPLYDSIESDKIMANRVTASIHMFLYWLVEVPDFKAKDKIFKAVSDIPPVSQTMSLFGDAGRYGTRLMWACASEACLNNIVYSLFEHKYMERRTYSERLVHICQLVEADLVAGECFVRAGVAREAQIHLIHALAYSKTFALKLRMSECMLQLVRLSSLQNFKADTYYHLSVLDKSLFASHQRRFSSSKNEPFISTTIKSTENKSADVLKNKVDDKNNRNLKALTKNSSGNKLKKSSQSDSDFKTPLKKSSKNNYPLVSGKKTKPKGFKVYIEEEEEEEKENVEGKKEVDKATDEDYDLSLKTLSLHLNDEDTTVSWNEAKEVLVLPDCWSNHEGSIDEDLKDVCVECADVLNARRLQLLKLVIDCEVSEKSDEEVIKAIELLETCKDQFSKAANKILTQNFDWNELSNDQTFDELFDDDNTSNIPFKEDLVFCDAWIRLKLFKLRKTKDVNKALKECIQYNSTLQKQVGMQGKAKEMAAQIELKSFHLKFQWPSIMGGYLSEMTLICSAVGRLLSHQEESSIDPLTQPTPHKKTSVSTSYSVFAEPEAPVKKSRKSRKHHLELKPSQESDDHHAPKQTNDQKALVDTMEILQSDPPFITYRNLCVSLAVNATNKFTMAHYLAEALSISLRHSLLYVFSKKKKNLEKEMKEEKKEEHETTLNHLSRMVSYADFTWDSQTFTSSLQYLPEDWTVCMVNSIVIADRNQLVLTRMEKKNPPIIIPLPHMTIKQRKEYVDRFEWIKRECTNNMKVTSRKEWWTNMMNLDNQMEDLLEDIEKEWLSCWRGAFLGRLINNDDQKALDKEVEKFFDLCPFVPSSNQKLVKMFLMGADGMEVRYILQALHYMSADQSLSLSELKKYVPAIQASAKRTSLSYASRGPVILILDKDIQHLPLENLPFLKNQTFTRQLSYHLMVANLACSMEDSILKAGVDKSSVFYVINPENNLPDTEDCFLNWFKKSGWVGVAGEAPKSEYLSNYLCNKDLFIYTGHGSGSKYLNGGSLQMLNCRSAALLMGCSSGRLWAHGELEPVGMLNYYFLAGSPCVMANLWEVTDKDINKFTSALLKAWMHSLQSTSSDSSFEDDKNSNKNKKSDLNQDYQNLPITNSYDDWLANIAVASRDACKLKYINGAAPVIYGFPITRKI